MDRDVALRIDGMLMNLRGALDMVVFHAAANVSEEELQKIRRLIGEAMYATIEIPSMLHKTHPDIIPRELKRSNQIV